MPNYSPTATAAVEASVAIIAKAAIDAQRRELTATVIEPSEGSADEWFAGATQSEGSWWPQWGAWIAKQSGAKVKARTPGSKAAPVLEDAPGSYVKVRSDG